MDFKIVHEGLIAKKKYWRCPCHPTQWHPIEAFKCPSCGKYREAYPVIEKTATKKEKNSLIKTVEFLDGTIAKFWKCGCYPDYWRSMDTELTCSMCGSIQPDSKVDTIFGEALKVPILKNVERESIMANIAINDEISAVKRKPEELWLCDCTTSNHKRHPEERYCYRCGAKSLGRPIIRVNDALAPEINGYWTCRCSELEQNRHSLHRAWCPSCGAIRPEGVKIDNVDVEVVNNAQDSKKGSGIVFKNVSSNIKPIIADHIEEYVGGVEAQMATTERKQYQDNLTAEERYWCCRCPEDRYDRNTTPKIHDILETRECLECGTRAEHRRRPEFVALQNYLKKRGADAIIQKKKSKSEEEGYPPLRGLLKNVVSVKPMPEPDEDEDVVTTNTPTHPDYWDCNCKSNYIHSRDEEECDRCGCIEEECADAYQGEINHISGLPNSINYKRPSRRGSRPLTLLGNGQPEITPKGTSTWAYKSPPIRTSKNNYDDLFYTIERAIEEHKHEIMKKE